MLTPELHVLKPIDPSLSHSDDYEIFTISDAQVVYAGKHGGLASLLSAYSDTPLRVEGRLEAPDRSQLRCRKPLKPVDIEVRNVTRYSYGQTEDGETVLWALGEAGWFELRPRPSYEEHFQEMMEAVEILYFITDIYNEPRKKGGGPTAPLIFQEYAEDERFQCQDPAEAEQIFNKHLPFLIMCFLNRAQGIGWGNTPLYQYYRKRYPNDFETARLRIEGKYVPPKPSRKQSAPTQAKAKSIQPSGVPKKDDNWWKASALFEFIQKAVNQRAVHVGHVTLERVAKLLVRRYQIDEEETARNVLRVHASNLCYMINHPRRKNLEAYRREPIYGELAVGHNLSAADVRRAESVELRPRRDHGTLKDEVSSDSDSSSSIETPQRRPVRMKKGRLSVLRPRSSKYSGKGNSVKYGKGKGKSPQSRTLTDSEDEGFQQSDSASEDEIDTPTQALSLGKRKHVTDAIDLTSRKRAASTSLESEPQSPPTSSSEDNDVHTEPLPLRWRSGNAPVKSTSPGLIPSIVSTPLPTYTPNGPRDSWLCTFDGCSQRIYGASTELGQSLIKEHFVDHANGRHNEVNILLNEELKLRLPVNNLLKRIREMSEQQQPLFPSLTQSAAAIHPQPIRRLA
ncbi:hypothetical protein K491DRAFT_602041 [Lophiostoma macrostomum CBS 122681]|uniref:DNA (cytosine-5)-methyltransferase 1 replication foci domain-containing protein n=1 Tax=Lophiostoma macrostomum CBS 122681 TaxID=1314788 RepID=A0A6A6T277_9PLEO|nr:hypothetical protein K491DRAFT_602041 [Lophiostoma macrostomum CBS 122681]